MKKKTLLGMLIGIASVICLAPTAKATTYNVGTAAELRAIQTSASRKYSGDIINLTADIDLGGTAFTPIGSSTYPFAGTFEGNDHTISGLYINTVYGDYQGLFGKTSSNSTIKNVTVQGNVTGRNYTGGLIGYNLGTIANCHSNVTVIGVESEEETISNIGGLIGYNEGNISNSSNSGSVRGEEKVGGLVGYNKNSILTNSYNTGTITGTDSGNEGGIVGYATGTNITDCYNSGRINGTSVMGGVVGRFASGTITNSHNSGTISGNTTVGGEIGGIIGFYTGTVTCTNCYNEGDITASNARDVGGIAGGPVASTSNIQISKCYNKGNITAGLGYVGGIGGQITGSVSQSYNSGKVTSTGGSYVGGIAGGTARTGTVNNVYNTGAVRGYDDGWSHIGGLIGIITSPQELRNGYNVGTVTDTNTEYGGIGKGGVVGGNESTVSNTYYLSTVATSGIFRDNDYGNVSGVAEPKEASALKAPAMVTTLNNGQSPTVWAQDILNINNGYPVFEWQNDAIILEIWNKEDAIAFRNLVNGGVDYSGLTVQLMADVDLEGSSSDQWTPIGTEAYPFAGTFEGNGHTISGVYINASSANNQGLFGYVNGNAAIKNLTVSGYVRGGGNVAGLVGSAKNVTISNCTNNCKVYGALSNTGSIVGCGWYIEISNAVNNGEISGSSSVGGIIGNISSNLCTLTECMNTKTISGSNNVGGIVGVSSGDKTDKIQKAVNKGNVTGTGSGVGGIVGYSTMTIEQCYNLGNVTTGNGAVGGITGYMKGNGKNLYNMGQVKGNGTTSSQVSIGGIFGYIEGITLEYAYNAGSVTNTNSTYSSLKGGIVGHCVNGSGSVERCYFLNTTASRIYATRTAGTFNNCESVTSAVLSSTTTVDNLNTSQSPTVWAQDTGNINNGYPIFKWQQTFPSTISVEEQNEGLVVTATATPGNLTISRYEFFVNDVRKAIVETSNTTASAEIGRLAFDSDNTISVTVHTTAGNTSSASTTMTGSLYIFNKADMESFRDKVNGGKRYSGKTINLMANIDLGGNVSNQWTPIGNTSHKFEGSFEGNEHEISGIYINNTSSGQGLFGYINSATTIVRNVTISGSITASNQSGGIVGIFTGGSIQNCTNNCNITGSSSSQYFGGIVGCIVSSGNIENCINNGTITANSSDVDCAGGIVGKTEYNSVITGCINTGTIKGNGTCLGGIVGYAENPTEISRCYNTGDISGKGNLGGIVGYDAGGIIDQCYNTGTITGNSTSNLVGGIFGSLRNENSQCKNVYNTGTINVWLGTSGNTSYYYTRSLGGIGGGAMNNSSILNAYNVGEVNNLLHEEWKGGILGANRIDESTSIGATASHTYYLNSVASYGIYNGSGVADVVGVTESKTSAELKASSMVDLLNNGQSPEVWGMDTQNINQGYPIFLWQGGTSSGGGDTDTTAPVGTISIESTKTIDGTKWTNSHTATIHLTVYDNVTTAANMKMKLINEVDYNPSNPTANITSWDNFAPTVTWQLSSGDGRKRVYVVFKDEAGNTSVGMNGN